MNVVCNFSCKLNLRSLKLTNCLNLVGHGLDPLCGSKVIKLIDLSLGTRFDGRNLFDQGIMSDVAVIPILESIINCDDSRLRCIQYPTKWSRRSYNRFVRHSIDKLQNKISSRRSDCCECGAIGNRWGQACYDCLPDICPQCQLLHGKIIHKCYNYKKSSCCSGSFECRGCNKHYCKGCSIACETCSSDFCTTCAIQSVGSCYGCRNMYCNAHSTECVGENVKTAAKAIVKSATV
jgi:hypothetical protein